MTQSEDLMDVERHNYRDEKPHILIQAVMFVKHDISFSSKFAFIFHGATKLKRGRYTYTYLGEDASKGRLVQKFLKIFHREVECRFQFAGNRTF